MAFFISDKMKLGLNTISIGFGLAMILIVVSGATALIFTDAMSDRLHGIKRVVFIFILLAYAMYRGFRMYLAIKSNRKHEE
jgi:hypothetical protein